MAKIEPSGKAFPPAQFSGADIEAIGAETLACQRGGQVIVAGLSFEVRAGTALTLRGPNGSGKTTLLRTIAGFLTPAQGRVYARSRAGGNIEDGYFHYIGHANGIKPRLSVFENIGFWQRYYDAGSDPAVAEAALDAFALLDLADFRAAHLSQGQARRLCLARLLTARRAVWLLDEPSASLDAESTRLLESALEKHLSRGGLAVISTHMELAVPKSAVLELGPASRRQ